MVGGVLLWQVQGRGLLSYAKQRQEGAAPTRSWFHRLVPGLTPPKDRAILKGGAASHLLLYPQGPAKRLARRMAQCTSTVSMNE